MKHFLLFVLASFSASTLAATPANFYECSGTKVSASYATQGLAGPVLSITIGGTTYQANNEEIRDEQTVLGHLVTLTTAAIPDLSTDTLTVLLPDVNVSGFGAKTDFLTRLFQTKTLTSFGGPSLVEGVIQNNRSVPVKCTATAVVF